MGKHRQKSCSNYTYCTVAMLWLKTGEVVQRLEEVCGEQKHSNAKKQSLSVKHRRLIQFHNQVWFSVAPIH